MTQQLINLENISLAYGLDLLLDQAKLQVSTGERVCLIGRNGAGKSSLLKIISGELKPDSGIVQRKNNLRVSMLQQILPHQASGTVYDFIAEGLADVGVLLSDYHHVIHQLEQNNNPADLVQLEKLQRLIDAKSGWHFEQKIKTIMSRLELNPESNVAELSGGWQRRASLAKALVNSPELLLLDEPTNHLDIEAIQWLEDYLATTTLGLIFITHDRSLLQRIATRIIELDRGKLTSWPGNYGNFLQHKEELLNAEEKQNAEFDKKLAREEKWIRQGIKARRTRNEGRVRALESLRDIRAKRRNVQGKAVFNLNKADESGQLVIEAIDISHQFNNKCIIQNFSLQVMRKDRIGLLGPNGIGKSTLLNILLKNLEPDQGAVKHGTKLQIAYFDQLRASLDLEKSVIDNVTQGTDTIEIDGKKRHVISYLSDFLFTPERARTPVKALSGGECNRLLLARLFSKPSNLLVMDEPTNDLDIETLELLEELLSQYSGTLLLVSHDRTFLDNVVTSTIVFAGNGELQEFVGGYQDWLDQKKEMESKAPTLKQAVTRERATKKLSYKEQQELQQLPEKIDLLEKEQQELQEMTSAPAFYSQAKNVVHDTMTKLANVTEKLEKAYQRWSELDNK